MTGTEPSIEVFVTPAGIGDLEARDRFCFVIDVLRACTSIAFALEAGAKGVIPVGTIEDATRLFGTLDRESTLLCGERGSVPIEGFHLGNSPGEYVSAAVEGKTLILATSNGAKALAALSGAKGCAAAALVNVSACARVARGESRVTIVCAGSAGRFSLEDFLCAGILVEEITRRSPGEPNLDDGARTALRVARALTGDLPGFLSRTDHGRTLVSLGSGEDLVLCGERDRFSTVPVLRDGRIVAERIPEPSPPR